jgi:uncharacterized protein YkwD
VRALVFASLVVIGAACSGGVLIMGVASRASDLIEEARSQATAAPGPAGETPAAPTPSRKPASTPTPDPHITDVSSAQATPPPEATPTTVAGATAEPVPALGATLALVANLVDGPAKAAYLLDAMNEARTKAGLPALIRDEALAGVARARANDLVGNGYFDHYSPAGESAFSELANRGIRYRLAGENLARNNYPDGRTAGAAFDALMASPGHRANILEPRFTHAGVSAVRNGRVWLYVTVFMD